MYLEKGVQSYGLGNMSVEKHRFNISYQKVLWDPYVYDDPKKTEQRFRALHTMN